MKEDIAGTRPKHQNDYRGCHGRTDRKTETPEKKRKRTSKRKSQRHYYSGKKKAHTLKTQLIINGDTKKIISLAFANGKKHDFRLFKESESSMLDDISKQLDSGYQ